MKIIAFGYRKGSGKDTAGKFLDTMLRAHNIKSCIASFADKLKDISYQLYSWTGLKRGIYYETHRDKKEVVLPAIGLSPRDIWIQVGNKLRDVYPETWIKYVLHNITCDIAIITDLRFCNEARVLQENNAILVQIERPGIKLGTDPAEVDLNSWRNWDFFIHNGGTLSDLNYKIETMAIELELFDE